MSVSRKMKLERWHGYVAALMVAIAGVAIAKNCSVASSGSTDGVVMKNDPLPAEPADLLCDLYVAAPNTSWAKLQRGVGGAVGILPANLPGVVIALTDLDPQLAVELDGAAPMYGVVASDPSDPDYVFAMKLVDARRARFLLINGDAGRYTAREDAGVPGMTLLVPNRPYGSAAPKLEIAISPNGYLLIGKNQADLARLGPYVTRTIPARPLPPDSSAAVIEIPRAALVSTIKPKIDAYWKDGKSFLMGQNDRMQRERGRPPDFGDPVAIIGVLDKVLSKRLAIVGDLEHIRVVVDITEDATTLTATLTPDKANADSSAKKWVDAMRVGDAAPVLAMPATSTIALSMRDGEPERAEQDADFEKAITGALGDRLKEPEKLHGVIEAITKARDESFALSFGLDDPPGLLLRAPVRDADSAQKAIRGVFDLAKIDPFKELLRVKTVSDTTTEDVPGLGKISTSMITTQSKKSGSLLPSLPNAPAPKASSSSGGLGVSYIVDQGTLVASAGAEPTVTLKVGSHPDHKLADEPAMKHFTAALGSDASTIVVVQPLRLDARRSNLPTSPLGIVIGKKGSDAFVRVDIADVLLREAARSQLGF